MKTAFASITSQARQGRLAFVRTSAFTSLPRICAHVLGMNGYEDHSTPGGDSA